VEYLIYEGFDISGKNCVISGAGGNIGSMLSIKLADLGVNIAALDIDATGLQKVSQKITRTKSAFLSIRADLTSSIEVEEAFRKIKDAWGKIDILINCVGTFGSGKYAEDLSESDWDRDLDINLKSVFLCCQKSGKQMIKHKYGKIINFSSQAGYDYIKGTPKSTYCIGKSSIIMLTKVLAYEWARYNLYVNAIAPGFIDLRDDQKGSSELGKKYSNLEMERINKIPLKRLGNINDLMGAIIFLSSDSSNFITGETIKIEGGYTLAI